MPLERLQLTRHRDRGTVAVETAVSLFLVMRPFGIVESAFQLWEHDGHRHV